MHFRGSAWSRISMASFCFGLTLEQFIKLNISSKKNINALLLKSLDVFNLIFNLMEFFIFLNLLIFSSQFLFLYLLVNIQGKSLY